MNRWALIEDGIVTNVIEQEDEPQIGGAWVDVTGLHVGPGCGYHNGEFSDPMPEPRIITKVATLSRFTDAEFVGIVTAAKTDVEVEAWKIKFDAASTITLDDPRTQAGVALLVSKGLLTEERGTAILTDPVLPSERP